MTPENIVKINELLNNNVTFMKQAFELCETLIKTEEDVCTIFGLPSEGVNLESFDELLIFFEERDGDIDFPDEKYCNMAAYIETKVTILRGKAESITDWGYYETMVSIVPSLTTQFINLKRLVLERLALNESPEWLGQLENLEDLNLNYSVFSDEIGNLTKLKKLELCDLYIETFPSWMTGLTNLESIWMNCNEIRSIPASIDQLTKLKTLDLGWNPIQSLPDSFGNLTALTHLDLRSTELTSLPESFANLTNLETLYLPLKSKDLLIDKIGDLPVTWS